MFSNPEIVKISEALNGSWLLVNGQPLSEVALDIFIDDVEVYPFAVVMTAISKARKQAKGRMTISDIMRHIESQDGRPTADEAWALAYQTTCETETVVMTEEIAEAWGAVTGLIEAGDKFNASKAFKEKYESLVAASRESAKPAAWFVNAGSDRELLAQAVEAARQEGKLNITQAAHYLTMEQSEGAYAAIESKVALLIESKGASASHFELDRISSIKQAGDLHQQRIAEMKKAAGVEEKPRIDGTKCKRDSLAIFEDAERAGVFESDKERKEWCAKAANGESMRELQIRMLQSRAKPPVEGAA